MKYKESYKSQMAELLKSFPKIVYAFSESRLERMHFISFNAMDQFANMARKNAFAFYQTKKDHIGTPLPYLEKIKLAGNTCLMMQEIMKCASPVKK